MRRSEGEEQGVEPEEGKKRSKRGMSRRREGAEGAGVIRAAMIYLCGYVGIERFCKYLNFESRVCYQKKNSWRMIRGYDSGV